MKRVVCLLLVVLIACAGCYDTEIDPISGRPITHVQPEDRMAEPVSGPKVPKLVKEPIELKAMTKQIEALRVRIAELEAAIESLRAVERPEEDLLVRMADLEAAIDSQRAEIKDLKNLYRVYEVAIESQRLTIETLQKLCRLYEAEIESQGKSRSSEESPLCEQPEAGQQQRDEQDSQRYGVGLPE